MQSDSSIGIAEANILSQISWGASTVGKEKLYALGASLIVRNKVWHQLGGFDDDYFVGYDDQDLGWRTWLLGYKVIGLSDSDAVVYHRPGLLRKGRGARFFRFHDFKNRLSSFIKNFQISTLLKEALRITNAIIGFCYADFKDGKIDGIRILFWLLKNLQKLLKKRYVIQKARRVDDRDIGPLWNPLVRGSLRRSGRFLW
jgi:GT2 family glycosyltransferase